MSRKRTRAAEATADTATGPNDDLPAGATEFNPAELEQQAGGGHARNEHDKHAPPAGGRAVQNALPPDARIADEDELKKQYGARPEEPPQADPGGRPDAHQETHVANPSGTRREPLAERDWSRYADPNPRHSVRWADGYEIAVQESKGRGTVEIQFGDGSTKDKPQNFGPIKEVLTRAGMHFNGTNAWAIELEMPPGKYRESQAERLARLGRNEELRGRIEDEVFPAVVALEEAERGRIELVDETRQRIARAAERAR